MRFINFLTESLSFVDLPELNKKFKDRFKCSLSDCNAKMEFNGGEVKLSEGELAILDIDIDTLIHFFEANGWVDCSKNSGELIFRQSREPVDNIKPYYELELSKNRNAVKLYKDLLNKLKFNFYHISTVSPKQLFATNGLRCRNSNNTKYPNRIYMVSGKMALKVVILENMIDEYMDINEIQEILDEKLIDIAKQMIDDIKLTWNNDHDTKIPELYMYKLELPSNWPVYKDPEYNDDDEFSACACFTNQNIPVKFIKIEKEITDSYI